VPVNAGIKISRYTFTLYDECLLFITFMEKKKLFFHFKHRKRGELLFLLLLLLLLLLYQEIDSTTLPLINFSVRICVYVCVFEYTFGSLARFIDVEENLCVLEPSKNIP
jgi:membrane-bound metal-dependent hydrolase YbcI (DUF457 family)